MKRVLFIFYSIIFLGSCNKDKENTLFTLMKPSETGIDFANNLPYNEEFNTYTYRNFYNGGGIALGDINNDGLLDIYFTGNIASSKLYLNKGNFKFEDISNKAGVSCNGVWSTGATFVDINGDQLLDLYVCKAGKPGGINRHNELFINQGNLTFKESSKEYGLDITGLSIHSAFFDFDKDGDLDCYVLNNSLRSVGGFDLKENQRTLPDPEGNLFLENVNGKFINIANKAGIFTSNIGYGLGITLSDFNLDNWTDIFISNDFFERDYLYINNQKGGFNEVGDQSFLSMSMGSMGADAGDIDNDLLPDLFVTEMLPNSMERKKTKNLYDNWDKYNTSVEKGYHHQFSRNVLQRNIGKGRFLEVGRKAGVAATDWSWAALIQDFDNDGRKDLFVSNGQFKDLLDRDYLNYSGDAVKIKSQIDKKQKVLTPLIDSMPSSPLKNFMYRNEGNFEFKNVSDSWGFNDATFSNGSAYGDLDNDGDLDLVINNANMPAFLYRNNTDTLKQRSIQFKLVGQKLNTRSLGAKIIIKHKNGQSVLENYSSRGFQSSVADKLTIGVGNVMKIDTTIIIWPGNKKQIYTNLITNKTYEIKENEASIDFLPVNSELSMIKKSDADINFKHIDHTLNLFSRERMLTEMPGFDGPAMAAADINNDGIEDIFCGGGRNQISILYISKGNQYLEIVEPFINDQKSEKIRAEFFDSDNDGDLDLYVAHGGKVFTIYSQELNDALYINNGNGEFIKKNNFTSFPKPISTGDIAIADFNKDGRLDVAIAEKFDQDTYGEKGSVYILFNLGANQYQCDSPASLKKIGMCSALGIIDFNKDGYKDLVIAGKWMPVIFALNEKGSFLNSKIQPETTGLWNDIEICDIDGDGDEDITLGNEGLNNFWNINQKMFINDFDQNGSLEQINCEKISNKFYPIHDNDEMFSQLPFLKKKFLKHNDLSKADIANLFDEKQIKNSVTFDIQELRTMVLVNNNGNFIKNIFPSEIQYSSVHAIHFDHKNRKIYFGGNHYRAKPQFGRQDASLGWVLKVDPELRWDTKPKPLYIDGEIRKITPIRNKLLFAINNNKIKQISLQNE